jgi:hypothetical protein
VGKAKKLFEARIKRKREMISMKSENQVNHVATYQTPIVAIYNGEPVRCIATCDMEGHSPVFQYIDGRGKVGWASQDQFQVLGFCC